MTDIVERLKVTSATDEIMSHWDNIRTYLLEGGKGSFARDVFESILSHIDEERDEAATEIADLRARCETLQADIVEQDSIHRTEVAEMALRFRAVNVERLFDLLPPDTTALLERATRAEAMCADLAGALEAITDRYVALVSSGDCGFWDAEEEAAVKESRSVLARREATP